MPSGASDGMILDLLRDSTLLLPRVAAANAVARHASQASHAPPDAGAAPAPEELPAEFTDAASVSGVDASSSAHGEAESGEVAGGRGAGQSAGRQGDAAGRTEGAGGAEPAPAAEEARRRQYAAMAASSSGGQPGGGSAGAEDRRVASALHAAARTEHSEDPVESLRARLAAARGAAGPAAAPKPSAGTGRASGGGRPAGGQGADLADWVDGAARGATLADVAASVDSAAAEAGIYSRRGRGRAPAPPSGRAPEQAHRGGAGALRHHFVGAHGSFAIGSRVHRDAFASPGHTSDRSMVWWDCLKLDLSQAFEAHSERACNKDTSAILPIEL